MSVTGAKQSAFNVPKNNSVVLNNSDYVYCVTVEDNHTVLVGRNGTLQWCGQCYGIMNTAYYQLVYDKVAGGDCTRLARQFVKYARKVFRENGYPLLYTDSVSKDSTIRLEDGETISVEKYWNMYTVNKYKDCKETAQCLKPILTCDDAHKNKFVLPSNIIRHKTTKQMHKIVLTNGHALDVTEDHSLITVDSKTQQLVPIKPGDIKQRNYVLVNKKIPRVVNSKNFVKELYMLMGHIVGNGNLIKQQHSKKYNYIKLSDKYIVDIINTIVKPLQQKYSFNITHETKPTDISLNTTELAEMMYSLGFNGTSSTKTIPAWLFNESDDNIKHFIKGYFSADGGIIEQLRCGVKAYTIRCSSINKNIIDGINTLFKIIGYETSVFSENKKTQYNGKQSKYNMLYLNVLDRDKFMNEIGFIYSVNYKPNNNINKHVWFADNSLVKKPSPHIKKHGRTIIDNMIKKPNSDFYLARVMHIDTYNMTDYVYDFSIEKYQRFYANDILVHNTDSWYFVDKFNDKQKYIKLKEKVIEDIKSSLPFPQVTFDADVDAEIKYMFFFKGDKTTSTETDPDMDADDIVNKPKGLMKKNYIYVTTDNDVVIKNLGIKKKNISAISKKIFWDYMVPKIKEQGKVKFTKTEIANIMKQWLTTDITLSYMRKEVGPLAQYKNSINSIQSQIAQKYGPGIHFLVPNKRGIGVGKKTKYCSADEFANYSMTISDIDFTNFWKELGYFINKPKPTTLLNWS